MPARALHVVITGDPKPFQRALAQAGAATTSFGAKHKTMSAKIGATGGALTKGLTVPLAAGAAASVHFAAKFEQQMSSLAAVTNAPKSAMESLRKQALKAGADTAFSAREAAIAQTELAKGGVSTANILSGGLNAALSLAAAGELDLGEAAAITANALNLFGLKGADASHVADAMATSANATTADVSDFGLALQQAGSVAKSAGLSFDQTMVALEALAANGVKGSDAGTSLKAAMIQLIKPTQKQANLADKLGLSFIDSSGKMKSLSGISAMLRDKLGGMTKAQRTATLAQLAGTDGVRTLTSLYDSGPKGLDKFAKGLGKVGSANDTAKKKQDNLAGNIEQLKGSLETLAIVIGTALIPPLTAVAKKLTTFANKAAAAFSALGPGGQQAVLAIVGIAAVIGPALVVTAKLINAFKIVRGAMIAVRGAMLITRAAAIAMNGAFLVARAGIMIFRGALIAMQVAMTVVRGAMIALRVIMLGMRVVAMTAFGPIGLAIMAIVAIGYLVVKNWSTVKAALAAVWNAIKTAASAVFAGIAWAAKNGLLGPVGLIIARWGQVKAILASAWNALKSIASAAFSAVASVVRAWMSRVIGIVRGYIGLWRTVGGALIKALAAGIRAVVGAVVAVAKFVASRALAAIRAYVGALRAAGSFLIRSLANGVKAVAGVVASAAKAIGERLLRGVRNIGGAMFNAGKFVIGKVADGARAVIGRVVGAARAVANGARNAVAALWAAFYHAGSALVGKFADGIKASIGRAVDAAKSLAHKVKSILPGSEPKDPSSPLRGLKQAGIAVGSNFASGVIAGTGKVVAAMRSLAKSGGDGFAFGIEQQIRDANAQLDELGASNDLADRQAAIDKAFKAANRGRRHGEKKSAYRSSIKDARNELNNLTRDANRANDAANIQFTITGLEKLRDFNNAMSDIRTSLTDLVTSATDAFIENRLSGALAAIDSSAEGQELAAIKQRQITRQAQQDNAAMSKAKLREASAVESLRKAQEALTRVQDSGSPRLVASAQARVANAQLAVNAAAQARQELSDEQRSTVLEAELEARRQAANDQADAARKGYDEEANAFRNSLSTRLNDEATALEQRKQNYAQFVSDVSAILGPLGLVFGATADQEGALMSPAAAAAKLVKVPKKKPKRRRRAAGGTVMSRLGELTRVNELGAEDIYLPRGARVVPASQSGGGPVIGNLNVYPQGAAGNDEAALAAFLAFKVSTARR